MFVHRYLKLNHGVSFHLSNDMISLWNQQNQQSYANLWCISLEVVETDIKATEESLKKYHNNGYNSTATCAFDIGFVESRPRKKRRVQ